MKLATKVVFLMLMVGAIVLVAEAEIAQRSARWDAYMSQPRHKRATSAWQGGGERASCTLQGLTSRDTLRRRASGLLSPVQHQGICGSCWAFAAAHTYTDHLSIAAGSRTSQLSARYLAACLRNRNLVVNGNGCCGAWELLAGFYFFRSTGAVTDTCAPYTLRRYSTNPFYKRGNPIERFCPATCSDGTSFQPGNRRLHSFQRLTNENEVITALRTGPVIAAMRTSDRFKYDYRCGVFCFDSRTDRLAGGHAVEIVDYGTTSSGINFWVVKNSWGDNWGEGGYFRIRRGDLISAFGTPVLSTSQPVTSPTVPFMACAPRNVSDPTDNTLVMSAADVAIIQLNGRIPCRDNSPATNITLDSVTNATAQTVDGTVLSFNIVVNVQGCSQTTQANVNAMMISYLNGTFELRNHTYQYLDNQDGSGTAITGNILLLIATAVLVIFTFGCF